MVSIRRFRKNQEKEKLFSSLSILKGRDLKMNTIICIYIKNSQCIDILYLFFVNYQFTSILYLFNNQHHAIIFNISTSALTDILLNATFCMGMTVALCLHADTSVA